MKNLIHLTIALFLGSLSIAHAAPMDFKSGADREMGNYSKDAWLAAQIFDNAAIGTLDLSFFDTRIGPTDILAGMTMPFSGPSTAATIGGQTMANPASGSASAGSTPAAAPGNNVLVVSEPPLLILLGAGLLLLGIRRKV